MGDDDQQLEVLLACFDGKQHAAKVRRTLNRRIKASGAAILDEVVFQVNAKGRAQVYDPRRVLKGTLTSALTWGLFGWIAGGGLSGLAIWAVLGAVCGGLYAYYTEHLLTKGELKKLGAKLSPDSSALLLFVHSLGDATALLGYVASFDPGPASVATVRSDLSAIVTSGAQNPLEIPSAAPGSIPLNSSTLLNMLAFRYDGADAAQRVYADAHSGAQANGMAIDTELLLRADKDARYHVASPKQGVRAMSWSDVVSWGLFGVVYGGIVGFAGNGGVFGFTKGAVVTGVAWALFGLVAGALYGLWAGRGTSARGLSGLLHLLDPDTSMVLAWSEGAVTGEAITQWSTPASAELILRFNPVPGGALLEA